MKNLNEKNGVFLLIVLTSFLLVACNFVSLDQFNSADNTDYSSQSSITNSTVETSSTTDTSQNTTESSGNPQLDNASSDSMTEESLENDIVTIDPVKEENIALYHYKLTEIGTFSNIERLAFSGDMPVIRETIDGEIVDFLYSYTGELKISSGCNSYTYLGNGFTAMYDYNGIVPTARLVNVYTGEIILEDNSMALVEKLSDRYCYIIHITEEVTENDNYFVCFSGLYISDGFAFFEGYGRVYDLQERKFIDNLIVTDPRSDYIPLAIGTTVFCKVRTNTYDIYQENGTVTSNVENVYLTKNGFIQTKDDNLVLYDYDYNTIAHVKNAKPFMEFGADGLIYSESYFNRGAYLNDQVVDINGNEIIPGTFKEVKINNDYIVVKNDDNMEQLYLGDGSLLLSEEYMYMNSIKTLPLLKLSSSTNSSIKYLYVPGCGIFDISDYWVDDLFYYKGDYKQYDFMVLATGETMRLTNSKTLIGTLMVDSDQGLIELINGTTVLEKGYDFVTATGEHLYVLHNDTWTVYQYELVND